MRLTMNHRALTLASSSLRSGSPKARPFHSPFRRRSTETVSIGYSGDVLKRLAMYSSSSLESSTSLELPLLPFESEEVLIPSESKMLHLYEARYLALLEESLLERKGLFVHFVMEPVLTDRSSSGTPFVAIYGCLVLIENIDRLDIGALVSIRGICRVSIVDLMQLEPYLRGIVMPIQDNAYNVVDEIESKVATLRASLDDLHSLQIKLKATRHELLQTRARNALVWAEKEVYDDCDKAFIPNLAERLSFAALQPVSGCSKSELFALQKEKLRAMDSRDTLDRLNVGIKVAKQNTALAAAKLAIQSLEI
ncbi:uncharacterized protein LOC110097504 isoform X1 [Dendrobium catenatum]|uniref:uncharacterized protein LOC110097504 isoform X1 n=1 Tax=Dendrobium catenatum TaxID=906689 RepID=UPI0009F716A7|nr:uncharacterized protein LOC110097504 isoform X1 [Dendrobium catenatum]